MSTIAFNGSLFAQNALSQFVAESAPLRAFSTDFSAVALQPGVSIYVPLVGTLTSTTEPNKYNGTGGTVSSVLVSMTGYKKVVVDFSDADALNNPTKLEQMAMEAGATLAGDVVADVLSSVTVANFGAATVTTAAANWTIAQHLALRAALAANKVKVRSGMISAVYDETVNTALLGTSAIYNAASFGNSTGVQEGVIPRLSGMPIYPTTIIPANSISLRGFQAHPMAMAVAMRYLKPLDPSGYMMAEPVVDPDSGVLMGTRILYDAGTGKLHITFECSYGYAVGVTKGLVFATVP